VADEREKFPILPVITGFFVAVLVLTPSAASKFIAVGGYNISGTTLFFPLSYLFNDILTEVYGYEKSRRIIWVGFVCQIFAATMYVLIQQLPAAPFWHNQAAYDTILGVAPRIVLGSLSAYFVGEFVNSFVLSKLKYFVSGRSGILLAIRFVISTVFGEFFDSAIFLTVGFYGIMPDADLVKTILTIWIIKSAYEVVSLPITMPVVAWIKRREGVDKIDRPGETNYSPFKL
jgi:queuosine precursor transporter